MSDHSEPSRRAVLLAGAAAFIGARSGAETLMEMRPASQRSHALAVRGLGPASQPDVPTGVLRVDYDSGGLADWALLWPPSDAASTTWIVMVHGHGSTGDQLYTRPDIRDGWLHVFRGTGAGILTPNLRGNAWMCPEAVADLHSLIELIRERYRGRRFVLASGSMGGTSNLIYAACRPDDVAGVVALCPAVDPASYYVWCRRHNTGVQKEIADAIQAAYRGSPHGATSRYAECSALRHASKLTMPLYVAHGTHDDVIPIGQPRKLVGALADAPNLCYVEVPGGGHDSPLSLASAGLEWVMRR